jgi:cell division protein FtsI (penicillin-binding protein 3)
MKLKDNIVFRYIILYVFVVAAGITVVVRMVGIQIADGEWAAKEKARLSLRKQEVPARRGDILTHDEKYILVTSMQKYVLHYDFRADGLYAHNDGQKYDRFSQYVDSIALGLAGILKEKTTREYAALWKRLRHEALKDPKKETHRYVPIAAKNVDYITLQKLKALPLFRERKNKGGLMVESMMERVRPYRNFAINTLGWVNAAKEGVGIEFSYQDYIAGKAGQEWRRRVGNGIFVPVSSEPEIKPIDGYDIVSTLDLDLQAIAEEAITSKLRNTIDLEWGTAVIMDVPTGEIRAIANKRKAKETGDIVEDENYALRYRKDPGSTFKLISFMFMLEKELDLQTEVDTENGSTTIYDKKYEDEGSVGGILTAQQVFEKSSNVGTIKLAKMIYKDMSNWPDFMERIEALKIKDITDFDINPQQNIAPVIRMRKDDGLALPAMSIGTALEITPLQTLTVYNAVANNGCMVHPRFIREIKKHNSIIKKRTPAKIINQSICSDKTLHKLQQMLIGVVENGTARRARSEIFTIAGKTGTAHIAEKDGYTKKKLASFVGYFPAETPKYSCIVAFGSLETNNKTYGGSIAAPVFKEIAEKTYAHSIDWLAPMDIINVIKEAPYTKSGSQSALFDVLGKLKIPVKSEINSQWVTTSSEDDNVTMQPRGIVKNLVPDVRNMGLMDAVYLLESVGIKARFAGRGTVRGQTPEAGAPFDEGDVVELKMSVM